jgi:hypothetical protein
MAFIFRLESADGAPAEPLALHTAVPNWTAGDAPAGRRTSLVVVGKRDDTTCGSAAGSRR